MNKDLILQAVARGWCSPENSGKEMDTTLAQAVADEVHRTVDEHVAMLLAAISTASIQNTPASAKERIHRDSPYWTQAYGDVCTAIDREMALRDTRPEGGAILATQDGLTPTGKRIAACERDAERLDFAEQKAATIYCSESGHWVFVDERAKTRRGEIGIHGIRSCIDAAMESHGPQSGSK